MRGSSLRFFSLLGGEASLLDAHIHLAALSAGEGVRKRQLASLWAPCCDRGRPEFGLLRWLSPPLPLSFPPFPFLPFPAPLQSIRILWPQYACARSAAGRARAWARTLLP